MKTSIILFSVCVIAYHQNAAQETFTEEEDQILENTRKLFEEPDWRTSIRAHNSFVEQRFRPPSELYHYYMLNYGTKEGRDVTWQQVNEWLRPTLDKMVSNSPIPSEEEKEYSSDIQTIVLDFLKMKLTKQELTPRVSKATEYYLDLMIKHNAIDLDILANAIVFLHPNLSSDQYKDYTGYVKAAALRNEQLVKEKWQPLLDQYEQAEDPELKARYLYAAKDLQQMSEERKYVESLLGASSL